MPSLGGEGHSIIVSYAASERVVNHKNDNSSDHCDKHAANVHSTDAWSSKHAAAKKPAPNPHLKSEGPAGDARRQKSGDPDAEAKAHRAVDELKHALGERGPVWWGNGSPDLNWHMTKNTLYAEWYAKLARSNQ